MFKFFVYNRKNERAVLSVKKFLLLVLTVCLLLSMTACSKTGDPKRVLIYSSAEEYRNEYFLQRLKAQFPSYDIKIEYLSSGTHAARLQAEGKQSPCDISLDIEYGSAEKLQDLFADLSAYDTSIYVDDMVLPGKKVLPSMRNGGCIAYNTDVLKSKELTPPASYADLLDPKYQGLISMPDPVSSGTGYMFLKSLVNTMGEDAAFTYFAELKKNIKQFTPSGSGPVNALTLGEAGIGLAVTATAVTQINSGTPLAVTFFSEGSPFACYGLAMIDGKQNNPAVKEVFDYFVSTLVREDKVKYYPEKIYKAEDFTIENYPANITYADMSGNTLEEKTRLQEKWKAQ